MNGPSSRRPEVPGGKSLPTGRSAAVGVGLRKKRVEDRGHVPFWKPSRTVLEVEIIAQKMFEDLPDVFVTPPPGRWSGQARIPDIPTRWSDLEMSGQADLEVRIRKEAR